MCRSNLQPVSQVEGIVQLSMMRVVQATLNALLSLHLFAVKLVRNKDEIGLAHYGLSMVKLEAAQSQICQQS